MSSQTRIITLNVGSQSLELALFQRKTRGELILENYRSRDWPQDSGEETARQRQIVAALSEMKRELKINGGAVNYTVAEELIFTRFIELPPVDVEKIGRIVSFEAKQHVPFPIDEVVWDYQQIGTGASDKIKVILAAIKTELIEEVNRAIEETGLRTSIVDLATMALFNAFRYNYGELDGCSLLIDIGARTTNLLFVESSRVFTRSIPLGGSSVTAAVAKEFNESFAAAESRKKQFSLAAQFGASPASLDGDLASVSGIILSTFSRLHTEILRSISHYCVQQHGQSPERVFLSGGGASPHSIRDFFFEKLQLPTDFFDPLRKVTLAPAAVSEGIRSISHLLGEPVGLALREIGNCAVTLNLCPESVTRRKEWERRQPYLVAAAVCFVLALTGLGLYDSFAAHLLWQEQRAIQERVCSLRRIASQMEEVHGRISDFERVATPVIDAINDRRFWPQIIGELEERLPKKEIWVTELVATSKGERLDPTGNHNSLAGAGPVTADKSTPSTTVRVQPRIDGLLVRGLYLFNSRQQEVAVDYFRSLVGSPWFVLNPNQQAKAIKPTMPNEEEWAFPYELHLDLRQPIALP